MWLMYECSDDNVTEFKRFYDTELSEEEKKKVQEAFLKGLMQPDTKRITMSTGYIKDGITYVTEGPLLGREKFIRKIDRHKRLAWLMIPAGNSIWKMSAGLEIVSKN